MTADISARRRRGRAEARRVLVLAYYFPPMGLSGVQRTARFVKYLPEFGYRPTVLTCEPRGYFAYDSTLEREIADIDVVRARSWDPTTFFGRRRTVAIPSEGRRRRLSALSQFLFVPDSKVGWIPAASRMARRIMAEQQFDVIFSTAPPYSAHLLGARISRRTGLPLVLDFRDDWLGNPRHVYPTPVHRSLSLTLEQRALRQGTRVIVINEEIRQNLLARNEAHVPPHDVVIIPQGFDPSDFEGPAPPRADQRFTLLYSGIFYDVQTPDYFIRALADLFTRRADLKGRLRAVFVGLLPAESMALAEQVGVAEVIQHKGYVPHDKTIELIRQADVLWMTVGRREGAETISTSKLFEYFGSRKPVLGLVPEGAARSALLKYGAAEIVDPHVIPEIAAAIERLYEKWSAGTLPAPHEDAVEKYDRRSLTQRLAEIFNGVVEGRSPAAKPISSALV